MRGSADSASDRVPQFARCVSSEPGSANPRARDHLPRIIEPMAVEPRVIAGRYRLFERLGKGAMGVVYRAHDALLDRAVAVKLMAGDMGDDARQRERFLTEARAAARLNHRHVVTIHEMAEVDGEICIIMELLDGVDLATLIAGPTQFPLASKLSIIDQVLDGLHYAHEQGVVHRDIKPANLHLTSAGVAKILDFGIARLVTAQLTGTRSILGTPAYMSPEQALGHEVDRRTDLFAVGTVCYELLSGARPFRADSIGQLMAVIAETPHAPLGPEFPREVTRLVDQLLAKDPAGRPDTAAAARVALVGPMRSGAVSPTTHDATVGISELVRETMTARQTILPVPAASEREPRPAARAEGARLPSSRGLTSFALRHGRTLRQQGDLVGAMQALRSVLEADPGNEEALAELQRVEEDLRGSGAGRGASAGSGVPPRRRRLAAAALLLVGAAGLTGWWYAGGGGGTDADPTLSMIQARSAAAPAMEATPPVPDDPTRDRSAELQASPSDPLGLDAPGPAPPGDGADGARDRFAQLSRIADRQGLDETVSGRVASIRSAAETAYAAGNLVEAGEIYARGIVLLEETVPPPPRGRPRRRDPGPGPGSAGENAIRRVIDEYAQGLEARDAVAVRRVRPQLSRYERRLLDAAEPPRVRFEGIEIQAGPGTATAIGSRIVESTGVNPGRQEERVQLILRRNGGRWQITDLRPAARTP